MYYNVHILFKNKYDIINYKYSIHNDHHEIKLYEEFNFKHYYLCNIFLFL